MADKTKSDAAKTMQDPKASKAEKSDAAKTMSPNAKGPGQSKKG
jgi:hypothetical protein